MTGYESKKAMARDKLIELAKDGMGMHSPDAPEYIVCEALIEALAQPSDSVEKPIDFELAYGEIYKDQRAALAKSLAQPAQQRQWIWLSDADIAEVVDTTCQYTGGYEEYLIKKAERKIRSMNNGT